MENSQIKLYIDIPKPYYYPGEQFLASILIEAFDTVNCNKMTIVAKGKKISKATQKICSELEEYEDSEEEEIEEPNDITNNLNNSNTKEKESSSIDNNTHKEIDEKMIIFKYKKNVNISNETYLSKGKYNFPFEVDIPENIPGSFLYMDGIIYIEIIYSVKIILNNINIKEMVPIIIRQKEKIFNYPKENEYLKKIGGCCWEKGESKIKINAIDKYFLGGNKIKLNILINNEKCSIQGSPINLEIYQKIVLFPKQKSKKIKITKLVGKYKGEKLVNQRENFNQDILFSINENKYISDNLLKTKAIKYFKNKDIIPLLAQSLKSDFVNCEYEVYAESQFTGWSIDELGVFLKIIMYPPEKGILSKNMSDITKEFSNCLVNKKIFLNSDTIDEIAELENKNKKEKNKDKDKDKDNKNNKKSKKEKKNKYLLKLKNSVNNDDDKENQNININYNINNDDINENFNINAYQNSKSYNNKNNDLELYEEDYDLSKKEKKNNKDINSNLIKKSYDQNYLNDALDNDNVFSEKTSKN